MKGFPDLTAEQEQSDEDAFYLEPTYEAALSSCWSLGPVEVCAKLIGTDRIDVVINLAGQKIGSGSLTAGNSRLCAGAKVLLVKASLCAIADFPGRTVKVEGKLCHKKLDTRWKCESFSGKLISW